MVGHGTKSWKKAVLMAVSKDFSIKNEFPVIANNYFDHMSHCATEIFVLGYKCFNTKFSLSRLDYSTGAWQKLYIDQDSATYQILDFYDHHLNFKKSNLYWI